LEFRTQTDYEKFLKGNVQFIQNKVKQNLWELHTCDICLWKYDNEPELKQHVKDSHHCKCVCHRDLQCWCSTCFDDHYNPTKDDYRKKARDYNLDAKDEFHEGDDTTR